METNKIANQRNVPYIPAGTPTGETRLTAEFITGKQAPLKMRKTRNQKAAKIYQLPFADINHAPGNHWILPTSNGYFGGYETGEAMALMFLKTIKEEGDHHPWLTYISESFRHRFQSVAEGSDEYKGLRGQHAGFFGALMTWLHKAAVLYGHSLDDVSMDELLAKANAGLNYDDNAHRRSLSDEDK